MRGGWKVASRAPIGASLAETLTLGVDRRGPGECWPWTKSTDRDGYGQFGRREGGKNVTYKAHVVAFTLENGPPVHGVLHRCNNHPCCNPECLYDGAPAANAVDRMTAGTVRCQAVLAVSDVLGMRARFADRRPTIAEMRELATHYGVTAKTIENAVTYRTWRNLAPGETT